LSERFVVSAYYEQFHVGWVDEGNPTFLKQLGLGELFSAIQANLLQIPRYEWEKDSYQKRKVWINEGIECELLNLGAKKWRKGKIRIKVSFEFFSDDPESPLDDIQQSMAEGN
jgi:KGK domain